MDLLDRYFELQKQIYDYFGYVEDWVVIPLDDATNTHWMLIEEPGGGGKVVYSKEQFTPESISEGKTIYSAEIYTQRFLPKWVYRVEKHTMVCADTNTDGNKFLMIFDNDKECKDEGLKALYDECW